MDGMSAGTVQETKTCTGCGETKDASQFYGNKGGALGLRNCTDCQGRYQHGWYEANRAAVLVQQAGYRAARRARKAEAKADAEAKAGMWAEMDAARQQREADAALRQAPPAMSSEWLMAEQGLCATAPDRDMWAARTVEAGEAAIEICGRCPVERECLEYAIGHPELDGIWGGTTRAGRGHLFRERTGMTRAEQRREQARVNREACAAERARRYRARDAEYSRKYRERKAA